MPDKTTPITMLKAKFAAAQADSFLKHYQAMIDEFQKSEWEPAIGKAGKFIEAALKALWVHVGEALPRARDFKADVVIRELERIPAADAEDIIRVTIPRACRFVYDIASNRGARHDNDEINPNEMDATAVVATCSWILAEMLRYAQKGEIDTTQARKLVADLTQKKFPVVENVEGRVYFHLKGLSARDVGLLTLWQAHPRRVPKDELIAAIRRHGSSEANAKMGVSRLDRVVDDGGIEGLLLLAPGLQEADRILSDPRRKKRVS